jgi:putative membrane protein
MITTAYTEHPYPFLKDRTLQAVAGAYAVVWVWAAIAPYDRTDWVLENLLVFAAIGFSVWLQRTRPLSDLSWILMAVFMVFHSVGSHYTYSLVPMGDWLKEALGLERNHYDRVIHFSFGLLITYPIWELARRSAITHRRWAGFFAFAIISTCSGIYELIEWAAAVIVDPEAGLAFLGTQGDPFDSQKDHVLALAGSLLALAIMRISHGKDR